MKKLVVSIYIILISTFNSSAVLSNEYIQDFFEIEEVFLLPSINTTSSQKIKYDYSKNILYVIDNDFIFENDSIYLELLTSKTNDTYSRSKLIFPKLNLHKKIFVTDLMVTDSLLYLLEFKNLIEFKRVKGNFIFSKTIPLELSCSRIYKLKNSQILLTSNLLSSDQFKTRKINFLYKIDLKNKSHKIKEFGHSKFFSLINVGPRQNKIFLDDNTILYSDIINFNLNIENEQEKKVIEIGKNKWKEDVSILSKIRTENANLKTTFIDFYNYHNEYSSILNIYKLRDKIVIQYKYNLEKDKKTYYDIYQIDKNNNFLLKDSELINNEIDSLESFSVDSFNFSNNIKIIDNFMIELSRFPFNKKTLFKNKDEFLKEREDFIIENGLTYSIIVRTLK